MAAIGGAIVTGIMALIGTGISIAGSEMSAAEEEKERKRLEKLGSARFAEEMKEKKRESGMAGLGYLAQQRMGAQGMARTRSFKKDFLQAAKSVSMQTKSQPETGSQQYGMKNTTFGGY
jgi:hypothetical protein